MGYSVELRKDGAVVEVPRHSEGGTYALGGTSRAELSITYNYSEHYEQIDDTGLRWLYGKRAGDTEDVLREAVGDLGTEKSDNYWEATEGNAGRALSILLDWAQQHPDAEWRVS